MDQVLKNGLTERFNGSLKGILKMFTDERQLDWDTYLPFLLFAYRTSYQSSLKTTQFGLLYGREAALLERESGPSTDRNGYVARMHEGFKSVP